MHLRIKQGKKRIANMLNNPLTVRKIAQNETSLKMDNNHINKQLNKSQFDLTPF